ncbi:MAG TPA: glycosyltransferase family 2 protein [Phycisphaerae bacterium]|jgi:glycosyltransferase involved in cell wall biosynthesis
MRTEILEAVQTRLTGAKTERMSEAPQIDLSVVVPIYNEVENVALLAGDILREVGKLNQSFEVILVNDGSNDGSADALDALARQHPGVKVIHFERNYGQTAAMAAGLEAAVGKAIVTMDGDRQNDPADIGMLVDKLDEGYACVSGWRQKRQDTGIRRWPSVVANRLISKVTGVRLHDYGCTLKAYRAGALNPGQMFGEMHRFLPVYVATGGGKVAEMVVRHHPRTAGVSKYGLNRTVRVLADLFLIRLLTKYRTRPSHLFARMAQFMGLFGLALLILAMVEKVRRTGAFFGIPFLTAVLMMVGAVIVLTVGLCTELVVRGHYLGTERSYWRVARRVNFDHEPDRQSG